MPDSLPSPTDLELVRALRAGKQQALRTVYERYGRLVYTLALRLLKRSDEAEDLTQEVFFTFWKDNKFDPQRAALSTYLCLVTRSRALNRLSQRASRQRSLQRLQQMENLETLEATPLERASQQEQHQQVRTALSQLSDSQQQVLGLSYYEGLSQTEIAQRLNLPLGTVKTNARQGLLKLRKLLGDAIA
jgi:RNA polymerase sigma-70 factor (ECF subfamily)